MWTEAIPTYEVLLTDSNPEIDVSGLGMRGLGNNAPANVVRTLRRLVDGYDRWISDREADAAALRGTHYGDTEYTRIATEQLRLCRAARDRMAAGIDLLERDATAMEAFQLANRVMATQRARTEWIRNGSVGEPDEDEGVWRPFQIGFLLLCLNGIAEAGHEDREVADLLWFPTGGGKTEAYLGLIAFTVFLRRLRLSPAGGGVTVFMRYTLRLLTLQQFERAAALICAMEVVRSRDRARLGADPISIGMWVGKAATPNHLDKKTDDKSADKMLRKLKRGEQVQEANPVQLRSCPWCGTAIDERQYEIDAALRRMVISCPLDSCEYRNGLPVHLVDEAIYAHHPTLVIATVDKFAQVTWRDDVAALFNRDLTDQGTPPPELIVQDELHLISGPLGTLTGLYEAAVDIAAGRPKVIASTATIRRAREQGRALFDRRDVAQFPRRASTPGTPGSPWRPRRGTKPPAAMWVCWRPAPPRPLSSYGPTRHSSTTPPASRETRRCATPTGLWSGTSTASACWRPRNSRSGTTSRTGSSCSPIGTGARTESGRPRCSPNSPAASPPAGSPLS